MAKEELNITSKSIVDTILDDSNVPLVLQIIGVEINEHFKVKFVHPFNIKRAIPNHEYWIDSRLKIHRDDDFKSYVDKTGNTIKPSLFLGDLLNGEVEIIKLSK